MSLKGRVRVGFAAAFGIILVLMLATIPPSNASAAQITSRTLTLQAGASDGGSKPSGNVNHLFTFTTATTANIGSIQFEYCTLASGTCTTPTGLNTSSATLGSQSGATGFTINVGTAGAPYITRTAATINSATALSYRLDGVVNPSTVGSFFVRITTFTSTNVSTGSTDTGTVTASTAQQITLTGTMPESIIFCTGGTITTTSGLPDCTTATSGAITFNQLFSPSAAATGSSQMAASTNSANGYVITVNGATMTNGATTIPALASATAAAVGNGQFGMNLVANTTTSATPAVGANIAPSSNGSTLKGQATTDYATADTFKFLSGDTIANSANGGAGPTNSQIYTSSYIVNVTGSQLAGTYTTTLTYICTATF